MYALPRKLLIIGLLLEDFATLLKRLSLKKKVRKCSIFLHQLFFFLMGRSGILFFGDNDQNASGEDKRKGRRGGMGREAQNEGFLCKIPTIKQDTNFISLTVGQTNI